MRCVILCAMFFLASCSPQASTPPHDGRHTARATPGQKSEQAYWWRAQINVHWPQGASPNWPIDALLANEVFAPIVDNSNSRPEVWRFHRRAKRDSSGHNFSFIFYAEPGAARKIFEQLDANSLLKSLAAHQVIDAVHLDDPSAPLRPRLEDTSDRVWPESLQRAWPAFAMGASEAWLSLVKQTASEETLDRTDAARLQAAYREVSSKVNVRWSDYGQHAFFHHLSALFGYEPLKLKMEVQF